jgi:hypothetical protein
MPSSRANLSKFVIVDENPPFLTVKHPDANESIYVSFGFFGYRGNLAQFIGEEYDWF